MLETVRSLKKQLMGLGSCLELSILQWTTYQNLNPKAYKQHLGFGSWGQNYIGHHLKVYTIKDIFHLRMYLFITITLYIYHVHVASPMCAQMQAWRGYLLTTDINASHIRSSNQATQNPGHTYGTKLGSWEPDVNFFIVQLLRETDCSS